MGPARALARRTAGDAGIRTLSFALLFAILPATWAISYRNSYPTLADRLKFAQAFGENKAARLFAGTPYDLTTVGGFAGWRVAGLLSLFAAFFGLLAAIRAFRGEEESGRFELVAAGAITRRRAYAARAVAIGATIVALWAATFAGLMAARLPAGGAAYLALATVAAAVVYAAIGIVASQCVATGRGAMQMGGAVLGIDFSLRVIADTADLSALHWSSPLGWVEELRPFAGPQPLVLLLPVAATCLLLAAGLAIELRRDIGSGLLPPRDEVRNPSMRFLGSPAALALRSEATSLAVWILGIGAFAFIIGTISNSVASGISADIEERLNRLGIKIATPSGYIGLTFLFFIFAISLFCCSQIAAAREDEAEGRLETLFALTAGRMRWLSERLALAVLGATLLAVVSGTGAALGATAVGADVSFPSLLGAGFNTLPPSLLFLGIAALLFAVAPRVGAGAAYALVTLAFVWELVGALLDVPSWMLGLSPFHQVGLVPAASFRPMPAAIMLAIGAGCALLAVIRFRNRDLVGA
jgi:ABC-2 type transport system permease protein